MKNNEHLQVKNRGEEFVQKLSTRIWLEEGNPRNEFVATRHYCHGYDLFDLMSGKSFPEVLYLLFRGELPETPQREIFEKLLIFAMNPGLRNSACRASVCAGVGNTDVLHILPVGLSAFSGQYAGAGIVSDCMRKLRKFSKEDPREIAAGLLPDFDLHSRDTENHIFPGFGQIYGGVDEFTGNAAVLFSNQSMSTPVFNWAQEFAQTLNEHNIGFLKSGLVAAVLLDLGFNHKHGAAVYQLMSAPGILAHGLEYASKPITAMPFPDDSNYEMQNDARK